MTLGAYRLCISYDDPQAYGAVIWKGGDDFTFLGLGYRVTAVEAASGRKAYVDEIREFEKGRLRRVLNGDEGGNTVFVAHGIVRRVAPCLRSATAEVWLRQCDPWLCPAWVSVGNELLSYSWRNEFSSSSHHFLGIYTFYTAK